MTDSKMPERIWADEADMRDNEGRPIRGDWWNVPSGNTEYIRADLAHPAPVADAELEGWRYEVKEGPNGEQVYAWVYDETGKMVATMKFEHAVKFVAALRARTAQPVGVRVRGLEWVESQTTYLNRETGKEEPSALFWQADTVLKVGGYTIMQLVDARIDRDKSGFRIEIRGSEQRHQTLEAAQAAAQADYEQRILSALLPEGGA